MIIGYSIKCLTNKVTDDEIWAQWQPVFDHAASFTRMHGGTLESALKNYQYPNGLPNLTKKQVVKTPYDEQKNYWVDGYGDKVKMLWKMTTPEGIYYFSRCDVICPSGDYLMFD